MNIASTECVVVASVLTNEANPGPCVCTAVAYWPYWESPEASKLAEAVVKCVRDNRQPTPYNVRGFLESEFQKWPFHPTFTNGLTMGLAEVEARSLLPHYKNKRIVEAIGRAYSVLIDNPDAATMVAKSLMVTLQDAL